MQISKKRLKSLIENYLFEQEEGPESKEDSKDKKVCKVKPMQIEVEGIALNLSTNKEGGVTFEVKGKGNEQTAVLLPKNVSGEDAEDKIAKKAFVDLFSGFFQWLDGIKPKEAQKLLNNIDCLIRMSAEDQLKPPLVMFRKKFLIDNPNPDSDTNSMIA